MVEADGGSRGNPGPAGFGALVRDPHSGEVLAEIAEPIGVATNNVAEYRGLIAGLRAAAEIDPGARVEARVDSKLVVEQMSGRWKIKHPDIRPLAEQAREIAAGLAGVAYTWVPRAENAHADRLANEAMDGVPVHRGPARPGGEHGAETSRDAVGDTVGGTGPGGASGPGHASGPSAAASGRTGWSAPDTTPTRLILLRHGQTPMSVERRFAGVSDVELTETGHAQARAAARRLAERGDIDVILSSPLRRTHDTAEHVARELSLPVEAWPGFAETDFGAWDGMTFAEVRERWPDEIARWLADPSVAPPGGESFASVAERVGAARDKALADYAGRTVLVVSHVTPIKVCLQQALLAPPEALFRMHLDVACLSEIDCYSDGPAVVRSFNDTAHLA
ncbi:bifunctional RNase H/acid phosphatase [Nocardiopsis gilva YIM 90087]|uniref:Bifunctional RNase H/acid phosphatase n=1 Tax=Nocardiopsis gilva YIM 90087 TaxID=1235441 RepID=A0A223S8S9_9ACTN|nr:bifunctional RNase H/acid phosphatase [Nocardiopsis gilva YIM 90087]